MGEFHTYRMECLITEVEKNRCLYDKEHPKYNDEEIKQRVWTTIGRRHGMKGPDCEAFWISICTRYVTALKIVKATKYLPEERILHSKNLKFMEKNLKGFVLAAEDEKLADDIIKEIKLEMQRDRENNNDGIPQNLLIILRQVKLKKWTDTALMNKYHSDKNPQYRRMVDAMVDIVKEAIKRKEALKKKTQRRAA